MLTRLACLRRWTRQPVDGAAGGLGDSLRTLWNMERQDDLALRAERREDRSLYSPHGIPRLRDSVVTYLDTLGTKARSSGLSNADLRSDIDDNDAYQQRLHSRFWTGSTQRMVTFSDNVCVAAPIEVGTLEEILRRQMDGAASFQLARVLSGRAIRGGITIGAVYCDSSYVDGPALIRAVELEEKVAQVPRVLIADQAATEIRQHWSGHAEPWPYRLAVVDADGSMFVNYLHASGPFVGAPAGSNVNPLAGRVDLHRSVVVHQLALPVPQKVRRKWEWVARYHNWFVGEFLPDRPDLRVPRFRELSCALL